MVWHKLVVVVSCCSPVFVSVGQLHIFCCVLSLSVFNHIFEGQPQSHQSLSSALTQNAKNAKQIRWQRQHHLLMNIE